MMADDIQSFVADRDADISHRDPAILDFRRGASNELCARLGKFPVFCELTFQLRQQLVFRNSGFPRNSDISCQCLYPKLADPTREALLGGRLLSDMRRDHLLEWVPWQGPTD